VLRLLAVIFLSVLLVLCIFSWHLYYTSFILLAALVVIVIEFFRFVTVTNQKLSQFLVSIKYQDFSTTRVSYKDQSFRELNDAFNVVTEEFRLLKEQQQFDSLLLQQILEQIPVGIICADKNGDILFYNRAALDMLKTEHLISLEYLVKINPELQKVFSFEEDPRAEGENFFRTSDNIPVLFKTNIFNFGRDKYKIFSLHNINNEMEVLEIESWQKLIRVITHEIMNSITPITSLATTLEDMAQSARENKANITEDDWNDTLLGLKTIRQRGEALLNFVENYRMLAKFPPAARQNVLIQHLFERLQLLITSNLLEKNVDLEIKLENEALAIHADVGQIEQGLINLLKNASEAVSGRTDGKILLSGFQEKEKVVITVADNGPGIPEQYIDKIFIPFYTTKEKGSGIGLTLTRQLIVNNGGFISVRSKAGVGTEFKIIFGK
jgi:nitrogen fixation/metabolism regulation signal transduction histidine kinase